jgi:hypothetical protein
MLFKVWFGCVNYLSKNTQYKGVATFVTSPLMLNVLYRMSFKHIATLDYDEYEYDGNKILKDMPMSQLFINCIPACYLVETSCEDFIKHSDQIRKQEEETVQKSENKKKPVTFLEIFSQIFDKPKL